MFLYVFGEMIEVECKFISEKYHDHYYQGHADQGVCAAADFVVKGLCDCLLFINILHFFFYLHFYLFAWGVPNLIFILYSTHVNYSLVMFLPSLTKQEGS